MATPQSVSNDRKQFVGILSVLLIGGFLVISLLSYRVARESLSHQIAENALPLTSDNIYSEIQRDLLRPIFVSSLMAQDTFVRDWVLHGERDNNAMIRYLKEIQERYNTVTSFFVSARTRKYYHPKGIIKTVSEDQEEDAWFFRTLSLPAGEDYEINIDADTADRHSTNVFVNYRVYDYGGSTIGITGVGLAVDSVKQLIEIYQQRYGRRVFFIDQRGEVTLHGKDFEGPTSIRKRPGLERLATLILTSPGSSFTYEKDGKTVYLNSRLVPEFKWYLIVEQASDPEERRLWNTLLVNLSLSVLVTGLVLLLAYLTLGRYQRRLENMATFDKLTGAMNRQVFEALYEKTLQNARRSREPLSVIMLDIDHFKRINDTQGHPAGDRVLRTLAKTIMGKTRESDSVCRWGGEEFLLLLPHCDYNRATALAESLREAVAQSELPVEQRGFGVTASFGVAQFQVDDRPEELIERADRALYEAKRAGRNRVSGIVV